MKPFYTINQTVAGCSHTLLLNDIILSSSNECDQVSRELKVNHWIKNGENKLILEIRSCEEGQHLAEDCFGELEVCSRNINDSQSVKNTLVKKRTPDFTTQNEGEVGEQYTLSLIFTASIPFENPPFYSSKMFDLKIHSDQLFEAFHKLWVYHLDEEWGKLQTLTTKRTQDLAIRFYKKEEEMFRMSNENLKSTIMEGFTLLSFEIDQFRVKVSANGRLATIEDKYGLPVIMYEDSEGILDMYKYFFYIDSNNTLAIIR